MMVATNKKTKKKVAIKQMPVVKDQAKALINEILIMRACRHPCIVEYMQSYLVKSKIWVASMKVQQFSHIGKVVMEYMDGCNLAEVIQYCGKDITEGHVAYVCKKTTEALAYLHSLASPIVHRGRNSFCSARASNSVQISRVIICWSINTARSN